MNKLEYHNMKYLNNNHIFVFILTAVAKLLLHYYTVFILLHCIIKTHLINVLIKNKKYQLDKVKL